MRTGPLRRHLLRIERGLASYRPVAPPPTPREPPRAAATLAALDRAYQPGDAIGNREIAAAGAVSRNDAAAIRQWAIAAGCWPYAHAPSGFRRRAKGGKS
jgi:hypothetical protein